MEENPTELDSISSILFFKSIHFLHCTLSILLSLSSNPLFSTIVALYTLILLYTPTFFFQIVLSPVLNATGILFFLLLKLGANERRRKESDSLESRILVSYYQHPKWESPEFLLEPGSDSESRILGSVDQDHERVLPKTHLGLAPESVPQQEVLGSAGDEYRKWALPETKSMESPTEDHKWVSPVSNSKPVDSTGSDIGSGSSRFYTDSFLEWNMRAPLEIIYEAYEGDEEDEEEEESKKKNYDVCGEKKTAVGLERYPSLSMCYPESDTDSSSDGEFPETGKRDSPQRMFFKWEEEDRDELIEISINNHGKRSDRCFHVEEDNLIEIDITPRRNGKFPGDSM